MKIAIQTPPEHTTFAALDELWQAADELGFSAAYTFDHFVPLNPGQRPGVSAAVPNGPQLEGWMSLCALAARTKNLHVGTLVTGVTYRHPALLAKMAVTLDHVTNGRAILGLGAAWHEAEHRMYGIPYPPVGERMGRLDEALHVFRSLCALQPGETTDYHGEWYQLEGAVFDPPPVRPSGIPILVGGSGPRLKRIAARHATMFNSFAAPWEWSAVNTELDELLAKNGRDAADMERTAFVFSDLTGDREREDGLVAHFQRTRGGTDEEVRRRVVIGNPDQMIEVLRGYEAAGIGTVILNLRPQTPLAGLERLAREVLPAFG